MYYALEMTLCKLDNGITAFKIQVPKENHVSILYTSEFDRDRDLFKH